MEDFFLVGFVLLIASEVSFAQYGRGWVDPRSQQQQQQPQRLSRTRGEVRKKPHHGRVNPDDYINILNRKVIVHPPKYVPRRQPHSKYVRNPYYKPTHVQHPKYNPTHVYNPSYPQYKQPYQQQQQRQQYPYHQGYKNTYNRGVNPNPYGYVVKKRSRMGYNPNTRYMPQWPKLRGHCKKAPNILIKGVDPIKEVCNKGRIVVLFLMKRRCDFCYHQLRELNTLAIHYTETGKPLSVIVINHKRGPLSPALIQKFPGLTFYEEPVDQDIFGRLGGAWRQIIVYDYCCRKQYLYGYPFSWMGYSFVRHAIFNTLYYDQVLCGVCKMKVANATTTLPPPPAVAVTTKFALPTETAKA